VFFAEGDDMVDALAADCSDQPLGKTVLPWRAWRNGLVADTHGSYSARDGSTVDPVAIADEVAWGLIPGEGFNNLLPDPFCRRVRGHIDPDKLSPSQPDNDQNVEQVKANGRNHEQIQGCDVRRVVTQEGAPALTRWITSRGHVFGDGRLRHREAELEQLAMNARRTPKPVVKAHPPDQRPQICSDLRPASQVPRFPAPIAPKTSTMPAHEGLGPDDHHGLEHRWKPTIQLDEEQAIAVRELDATAHLALQDDQLMPEHGIFCFKSGFRLERRGQQRQ
jgi:hypothetical protein